MRTVGQLYNKLHLSCLRKKATHVCLLNNTQGYSEVYGDTLKWHKGLDLSPFQQSFWWRAVCGTISLVFIRRTHCCLSVIVGWGRCSSVVFSRMETSGDAVLINDGGKLKCTLRIRVHRCSQKFASGSSSLKHNKPDVFAISGDIKSHTPLWHTLKWTLTRTALTPTLKCIQNQFSL